MRSSPVPESDSDQVDEAASLDGHSEIADGSFDESASDLDRLQDCLKRVRQGDPHAIAELYNRYLDRSVRLAKSRLRVGEDHLIDDEQAAMSALESLIIRVRGGSYSDIKDHLKLWNLLACIINRKLIKYRRSMYGPTRSPEQPFIPVNEIDGDSSNNFGVNVVDHEPSPLSAVIANDTLQQILDNLSDPDARSVLLLRLEGYSDSEIADQLNHSRSWVARRTSAIRRVAKSLLRDAT